MADIGSQHISFDNLAHYDAKIKQYVDEKTDNLVATCDAINQLQEDTRKLFDQVSDVDKQAAVNATEIENLNQDVTRIDNAIAADHVVLENTRLALENKADEQHTHHVHDIVDFIAPDLSGYYTKQEVDLITGPLITSDEFYVAIQDTVNRTELSEVKDALTAQINSKADAEDIPVKLSDLENDLNFLTHVPAEYITETELAARGFLTEHQDLSDYVKTECLDHYASKEYVLQKIAEAELTGQGVDLSAYYTKTETEAAIKTAIDAIDIPDVSNLVTKAELEAVQDVASSNSEKLLTIESDLVDISQTLENIPTTYATKTEVAAVDAKVDAIVIPKVPTKVSELENDAKFITIADVPETDLSDYYTKSETENQIAEAIKDIEHPTVNLDGYATEAWVNQQGFLTEHQDLSDYAKKSDIPSLEGYATETFVTDAISNIKHPDPDLSNYYTKGETDSAINAAIDGIEIPEVDLAPYATKAQVAEQVAAKADNILFTTDMRVTTPSGLFVEQESVQNLTITEIITKLLGLTLYTPPVTPEGVLEGTPQSAVTIITNEIPAYMLTNNGIVVVPYEYRILTIEEGAQDNQSESFLYQIVDESNIAVETGYQIVTQELSEGWVTICVPETVTKFSVKIYDGMAGAWVTPEWKLLPNAELSLDGYVVYTVDPDYDIYESTSLRIVIED